MTFFEYYLFVGLCYTILNFIYTIIILFKYKLNLLILPFLVSSILIIFAWPIHLYYVIYIIFDKRFREHLADEYKQNINDQNK